MTGENDGVALGEGLYQLSDLNYLNRVEANRRLVKDDDLGITEHRLSNAYSLSVTLGKILDKSVVNGRKVCQIYYLIYLRIKLASAKALCSADEFQILGHLHIEIQRRLLGKVAYAFFRFYRLTEDVVAVDGDRTVTCRKTACDDIHGRTLTCTVRT